MTKIITLSVEKTYTGNFAKQIQVDIEEKNKNYAKIYEILRQTLNMYGCSESFYNHRYLLVSRSGSGFNIKYKMEYPPAKQNIQELEDALRKAFELCLGEIKKLDPEGSFEKIVKGLQKKKYAITYNFD